MDKANLIRESARWIATFAFLYAAYRVYNCPCKGLITCHQADFYGALGVGVGAIWFQNYYVKGSIF